MDTIKKGIIIVTIMIIIIMIAVFIMFFNKNRENSGNIQNEQSLEESFQEANKLKKIESEKEWINVQNCLDKYYTYSDQWKLMEELEEEIKVNTIEQELYNERTKKKLTDIIPEFVKNSLEITEENIYKKIGTKNEIIRVSNIYRSMQTINMIAYEETTNIYAYVVEGILVNRENHNKKDFKAIVLIDNINNTFAIVPNEYIESEKINLLENDNLKLYNEEQIEKKEYNALPSSIEGNEEICRKYFANYKLYLIYDTEFVYECLDKEYREERFGDLENFQKFVKNNLEEINKSELKKYLVNNYDGYTEYVCQDQYQNLYVFNQKGILDYTLKLDTYTIPTEKFITTYKSAKEQDKVMMNVDKWVQMLNNRDYESAYEILDETYRNNTFGSEEKFEKIMRKKVSSHYKVQYTEFSKEKDTYIQRIKLKDVMGETENTMQISIIMKLKEELDFVMSFSFDE